MGIEGTCPPGIDEPSPKADTSAATATQRRPAAGTPSDPEHLPAMSCSARTELRMISTTRFSFSSRTPRWTLFP
jgi:hypothetical protein